MNKRWLVVSVVAIVMVAGGIIYSIGDVHRWWGESCDISQTIPERPMPSDAAPGGGGVRVVESGFTPGRSGQRPLTAGAVLQNTSKRIAYRTRVVFDVVRRQSGAGARTSNSHDLEVEVPVIMPGQQVGVGRRSAVNESLVLRSVDPRATTWLGRGALGTDFATPRIKYQRTVHFDPKNLGGAEVRYRENSNNCRALKSRAAAVVFRNGDGKIVGGDLVKPDQVVVYKNRFFDVVGEHRKPPKSASCSPGRRQTWLPVTTSIGPAVDDARTKVWSYCDVTSPDDDVNDKAS